MNPPIRVLIADDHALFRQGLKLMLRFQPDIRVIAELERADDVLPVLEGIACDMLLLDLQMERNALADIEAAAKRVAVIVVTATERVDDAIEAIRAGARGVVFKRLALETLMNAIHSAVQGRIWLPPTVSSQITEGLGRPIGPSLTTRENDIIRLTALGLRNAEVAERLAITTVTVKTHLNNIFQKLGLRDRVELARYAIRRHIVGVEDQ
jgi:DNA-binding NarL/FixJ family response regulator